MAYYGYIRVSTKGQVPGTSLAEQEQQIKERYPTAIIVKEAASGAHERQVFDNLCKSLQAGDTLVVCKMDRFCRSAKEGLQYVDMDSVVALLKERVPGYVPSKDEYNGLVEDVLANWKYIWNEAIVYNVLATIVYTNEPKKDFDWYDGLKLLHLIDFAAWQQWCDA